MYLLVVCQNKIPKRKSVPCFVRLQTLQTNVMFAWCRSDGGSWQWYPIFLEEFQQDDVPFPFTLMGHQVNHCCLSTDRQHSVSPFPVPPSLSNRCAGHLLEISNSLWNVTLTHVFEMRMICTFQSEGYAALHRKNSPN